MSFTDQKPFTVTANQLKLNWAGGKDGKYFRCGLCGHKFKEGDYARWIFTNDIPNCGGNPFVCYDCDSIDVKDKWKDHCAAWKDVKEVFWKFLRTYKEE